MRYWVRIDRATTGPHMPGALRRMRGFTKESLVCPSGEREWRPAESVDGLKFLFEPETTGEEAKEKRREERRSRREERRAERKAKREEEKKARAPDPERLAKAERGFNPILALLVAGVLGGAGWYGWQWRQTRRPEPEAPAAEPAPSRHEARKQHWAWLALGKKASAIQDTLAGPEAVSPDGSERFRDGGELADWRDYETLLVDDAGTERTVYGFRRGVCVAAGRRFEGEPADLPGIGEAMPRSFAGELSVKKEGDRWAMRWDVEGESWTATVAEDPARKDTLDGWRVRSFRVSKP